MGLLLLRKPVSAGEPPPPSYSLSNAWQFSAGTQRIEVDYHASLNIRTNLSVEAIINISAADTGANQHIINRRLSGGIQYQMYLINSSGHLGVYINQGAGDEKLWTHAVNLTGAPHQVGFTFDTSTLKVFVDGVDVSAGMTKGIDDAMTTLVNNTADPVRISGIESDGFHVKGKVGRVTIWDTAVLTASEYAELWNSGTPTDPTTDHGNYTSSADLAMALLMESDDATGADGVVDASGNANHGTVVGTPTLTTW